MLASRFTGTSQKTVLMCKTHVYCYLSYPGRGPHHPGNYQGIIRELSGDYQDNYSENERDKCTNRSKFCNLQ